MAWSQFFHRFALLLVAANAQPSNVRVQPVSFGRAEVSWQADPAAVSYNVSVGPAVMTYDFAGGALPDPEQWVWDNSGDLTTAYGVDNGRLYVSLHASADCYTSRGKCPLLYRRPMPEVIAETFVGLSDASAIKTVAGGIVVYSARSNRQLFSCQFVRESSTVLYVQVIGPGGLLAPTLTVPDDFSRWNVNGIWMRVVRDSASGSFTCLARNSATRAWADVRKARTIYDDQLDAFTDGDLWYGVMGRGWGGNSATWGNVTFDYFTLMTQLPAGNAPLDMYGNTDVCAAQQNFVPAVWRSVPAASTNVTISGLATNFPLTAIVRAVYSGGSLSAATTTAQWFYARSMPPRWQTLGLWLDAKYLPAGDLTQWMDSSTGGHVFSAPGSSYQPTARENAMGRSGALSFNANDPDYLTGDSNSFDLGLSTALTAYVVMTTSAQVPQFILTRGHSSTSSTSSYGWSFIYYQSGTTYPAPGVVGVRMGDSAVPRNTAGVRRPIANTGVVGVYGFSMRPTGAEDPAKWFNEHQLFVHGNGDTSVQVPGFQVPGSTPYVPNPVWVDYQRLNGTAYPTPSNTYALRIGHSSSSFITRSTAFQGDLYGVLLFREAHDNDTIAAVTSWLNSYYDRSCDVDMVSPSSTSTCYGGVQGSTCTQSCTPGYLAVSGATAHSCTGGEWTGGALTCDKQCTTLSAPLRFATCIKTLWSDAFSMVSGGTKAFAANASMPTGINPYVTFPVLPASMSMTMWTFDNATGVLRGDTNDACARTPATIFGLPRDGWDTKVPTSAFLRVRALVRLDAAGTGPTSTAAGVVARLLDENNHYRVEVSPGTGVTLMVVSAGVTTALATNASFQVAWGSWFDIEIEAEGTSLTATVSSVASGASTTLTGTDASISWGSAGVYLSGTGAFDNLSVKTACDVAGSCLRMAAGMSCSYTCGSGFLPIGTGSYMCGEDGLWAGSLMCVNQPPRLLPQSFAVLEHSAPGTPVSPAVNATPPSPLNSVSFRIMNQWPQNDTFDIGFCSGELAVQNGLKLNIPRYGNVQYVNVSAFTDGDDTITAYATMSVWVTDVNDPPAFSTNYNMQVDENEWGTIGTVVAVDPEGNAVNYSIIYGNDAVPPKFAIDGVTGIVSVLQPGLNYEQQRTFAMIVQAMDSTDATLTSTTTLTVTVRDVNDRPTATPQALTIDENGVSVGASPGAFTALDEDCCAPDNTLSYSITDNAMNGGSPVFDIDPNTGEITFLQAFTYGITVPVVLIDGRQVKAVFRVNVTACSGVLCTPPTLASIYVTPNNTGQLTCQLQGINALASPTTGGGAVELLGANFELGATIRALYTNPDNITYLASACTVTSISSISCTTVAGYGSSLQWQLSQNGVACLMSGVVQSSYAAPVVDSVTVAGAPVYTTGGASVTIRGRGFGNSQQAISVFFGTSPVLQMTSIALVTDGRITAVLPEGCGGNLPVTVSVGTAAPSLSVASDPRNAVVSYSPPISSLSTFRFWYTSGPRPLSAAGGQTSAWSRQVLPRRHQVCTRTDSWCADNIFIYPSTSTQGLLGPSWAPVIATMYSARQNLTLTLTCLKTGLTGKAAHLQAACTMPAGVGTDWAWSLEVCGQQEVCWDNCAFWKSYHATSYEAPSISSVTTPVNADTVGGQQLVITGRGGFGAPWAPGSPGLSPIDYVRYGPWNNRQMFAAQSCVVNSNTQITCLTGPGYGSGLSLQISVGGQVATYSSGVMSYGAPVVASFSGPAATAGDTRGLPYPNGTVYINGLNFGPYSGSHIVVSYATTISGRRTSDGSLPFNGRISLPPAWFNMSCMVTVPHTQLACNLAPGAGADFVWSVRVGNLVNTQPTTAYGRPLIQQLVMLDSMNASTTGGERVLMLGKNFGPSNSLIQSITYGPLGVEYAVRNWTLVNHTALIFWTVPGVGQGNRAVITVADQPSSISTATFDYARPTIIMLSPSSGYPTVDPTRPRMITVRGRNLGLSSAATSVVIGWGNAGDHTFRSLPITSRKPDIATVTAPGYTPVANQIEEIQFLQPNGLGLDRAIRVVPYLVSSGLPTDNVVQAVMPTGVNDLFDYFDPYLWSVSVYGVESNSSAETACRRTGVCRPDVPLANVKQLSMTGLYLGPLPAVLNDTIQRLVEYSDNYWGPYVPGVVVPDLDAWTESSVVAYTTMQSGYVRARIVSVDPWGNLQNQTSPWPLTFQDVSPSIDQLVGATENLPTAGGSVLGVRARNLAFGTNYSVTIGGSPCVILDGPNGQPVPPDQIRDRIILNGSASFPPDYVWTLWAVVPEGQGTWVSVVVVRDDSPSFSWFFVSYAPPTLASWAPCTGVGVCGALQPITFTTVIRAPTKDGRIRLVGTNLGTCPSVYVASQWVYACEGNPDPRGQPIPNARFNRTHTWMEFDVPEGEGMGPEPGTLYSITLDVGGQSPLSSSAISFAYNPPIVSSVNPVQSPTRGGSTVWISGSNFGYRALPIVQLGAAAIGWKTCASVTRSSHFLLGCTVPEGVGMSLFVNVSVAGQYGMSTTGIFNYIPPIIASIERTYPAESMQYPPRLNSSAFANITQDGVSRLRGDTSGGYNVTIRGSNFGPGVMPGVACAFASWQSATITAGRDLACDGYETFLGEGEVFADAVLQWTHEEVTFLMRPGVSFMRVTLRVGGQAPSNEYVNFKYEDPILLRVASSRGISTNGGTYAWVSGYYLPRDFYNASELSFPVSLPLDDYMIMPYAYTSIRFSKRCATSARLPSGALPPVVKDCERDAIAYAFDYYMYVRVPSGVGKNKTAQLTIWDSGGIAAQSNLLNFSYAKPTIDSVSPAPFFMTSESEPREISIEGSNHGLLADQPLWDEEEKYIGVNIGGIACSTPQRIVGRFGDETVFCTLPPIAVGYANMTLDIAGQTGFLNYTDPDTLYAVCDAGYYGRPGERCLPCPLGGLCLGYVHEPASAHGPGDAEDSMGGVHKYPIPLAGWYNYNGSQAYACPPGQQVPGRDLCLVACQPVEACLGANLCAEGYTSVAPAFRCAACAKGYFSSNGLCIKCPNSPVAIVIGIVLVALAVAGAGYFFNKRNVNVAHISIGVDFIQVLAIFANARVKWPAELKQLWRIFSAFNLNIDIVAPECFVPEVSFISKWAFVELLPIFVGSVLLIIHGALVVWKRYVRKQRRWEVVLSHVDVLVASGLIVFYFLYLYLTTTTLNIFNCAPLDPPDGKEYLQVVFEECGVPGGTQMTLMPAAVLALLGYTFGYPAFLASLFWFKRELLMEDQLLRAKGVGDDKLTNPNALHMRKRFSRTYYQFKPDLYFWILAILLRKFFLAFTALMFRRNSGFQLAAALLVLFLSYAAHVRWLPYMSPSEFDQVLKDHEAASFTSKLHARLRAQLQAVEVRGRKRTHRNLLKSNGRVDPGAVLGVLGSWLFNYNTVEGILLFVAIIVCLMGIMYTATEFTRSPVTYKNTKDGITAAVIALVIIAIVYYAIVVCVEIYMKMQEQARMKALAERAKTRAKSGKSVGSTRKLDGGSSGEGGSGPQREDEVIVGNVEATMNPMFLLQAQAADAAASSDAAVTGFKAHEAIMASQEMPGVELWKVFRGTYLELHTQMQRLNTHLSAMTAEKAKLLATIEDAGIADDGTKLRISSKANSRQRVEFGAIMAATSDDAQAARAGAASPPPNREGVASPVPGSSRALLPNRSQRGFNAGGGAPTAHAAYRSPASLALSRTGASMRTMSPVPPSAGFGSRPYGAASPPPPPPPPSSQS